jgi:cell division transport system ATP-binding protein
LIKFENITKKFPDGTIALKDINLTIDSGEFVFLTGPSGAGKTTLLRLVTRHFLPSSGKIFFNDKEITNLKKRELPALRRRIGVVFQDFKLLTDRTVFENISVALEIIKHNDREIKDKVDHILSLVRLKGKEKLFPRQLAGGELQRVSLARSLALNPEAIFADEPTGNLDPDTSWQIMDLLKKINKKGITMLVATHNYDIVDSMDERVVRLEKGRIVSDEKKGKYKK